MKRPSLASAIMVIIGILSGQYISLRGCAAIVFFVAMLSIVVKPKINTKYVYTMPVFVCVGILVISLANKPLTQYLQEASVNGVVWEAKITNSGRQSLVLKTKEINSINVTQPVKATVSIVLEEGVFVKEGDLIVAKGNLSTGDKANNPGGFDNFGYIKSQGYKYTMFAHEVTKYGEEHHVFKERISNLRQRINTVFDMCLPKEESAIVKAMVTGDTSFVSEDVKQIYNDAGIAHVLAVSGLHITILAAIFLVVLNKGIGLGGRSASLIVMVFLLFYMVFVGNKTAAVRAVIMAEVMLFGKVIDRERDALNSIGFAAIIILILNPHQLFSAGFLLSFITVIGLVLISKTIREGRNFKEKIWSSFKVAFLVNLVSLPIIAWYFYKVPLLGSFANLIVIPLAGIVVGLGIVAGVAGMFWINVGVFLCGPVYIVLKIYEVVCTATTSIPFATFLSGRPMLLFCVLYYFLLLILYFGRKRKKKLKVAFAITLCSLLFVTVGNRLVFKNSTVNFLYVGQGDSAVINTYDNKTFVIDGGGNFLGENKDNTGVSVVIPFLESKGIGKIDGLFITHMDTDHVLGAIELIKYYKVKKVFIADYETEDTKLLNSVLTSAQKNNVDVKKISAGAVGQIGKNINIECLYPYNQKIIDDGNDNHGSLVLKLNCGEKSFLFMGDAEEADENLMALGQQNLKADVIKVGHHGSKGSTSEMLLQNVTPSFSVISCGINNTYGHPHEETLKKLSKNQIKIYNTSLMGAVTFTTNGKYISVKTMK